MKYTLTLLMLCIANTGIVQAAEVTTTSSTSTPEECFYVRVHDKKTGYFITSICIMGKESSAILPLIASAYSKAPKSLFICKPERDPVLPTENDFTVSSPELPSGTINPTLADIKKYGIKSLKDSPLITFPAGFFPRNIPKDISVFLDSKAKDDGKKS